MLYANVELSISVKYQAYNVFSFQLFTKLESIWINYCIWNMIIAIMIFLTTCERERLGLWEGQAMFCGRSCLSGGEFPQLHHPHDTTLWHILIWQSRYTLVCVTWRFSDIYSWLGGIPMSCSDRLLVPEDNLVLELWSRGHPPSLTLQPC